ncbi:unnamed protein product, partial [Staurois parvus]
MPGHYSCHRHPCRGTIPATDTHAGALFLPPTPMRGTFRHPCRGTIPATDTLPPTDTNDGDTIPPTDTNDGALFLPLIPMMG